MLHISFWFKKWNKGIKNSIDQDVADVSFQKVTQWSIAENNVIAEWKSATAQLKKEKFKDWL